jgi:hypothetical protein
MLETVFRSSGPGRSLVPVDRSANARVATARSRLVATYVFLAAIDIAAWCWARGMPIHAILVLPALFAAGMSLVDTTDSVMMVGEPVGAGQTLAPAVLQHDDHPCLDRRCGGHRRDLGSRSSRVKIGSSALCVTPPMRPMGEVSA